MRESIVWYGGLGLLAIQVARNLALPPHYFALVARQIDIIGVRSTAVALTAALFTGMVLALQTAVNMARFGAENYVGPVVALSILRELGPVLTAILVGRQGRLRHHRRAGVDEGDRADRRAARARRRTT